MYPIYPPYLPLTNRTKFLSAQGLYDYDGSIFQYFTVPDYLSREVAIMMILTETAELGLLFPAPESFKNRIRIWCASNFDIWKRLADTITIEYAMLDSSYRDEIRKVVEEHDLHLNTVNNASGSATDNETIKADGNESANTSGSVDVENSENVEGNTKSDTTSENDTTSRNDVHTASDSLQEDVSKTTTNTTGDITNVSNSEQITHGESNSTKTINHAVNAYNAGIPTPATLDTETTNTITDGTTEATASDTQNSKSNVVVDGTNSGNSKGNSETNETGSINVTGTSTTTGDSETLSEGESHTTSSGKSDSLFNTNSQRELNSGTVTNASEKRDDTGTMTTTTTFSMHGSGENNAPQDIILKEREVAIFNLYEFIVESFKQYFCIMCY